MTHVLVTGGAGFIGSHLVDRLLADGHEVTVVDNLSSGHLYNLGPARRDPDLPLHFVRLDITSDALDRAIAKAAPRIVCHLAAQTDVRRSVEDPVRDAMVNVVGTVNVLESCRRHDVGKVVFTSSGGCIYGEPSPHDLPLAEDHAGHPTSPHGAGKRGVDEYLWAYASLYGLRWTSLALGNVYGPRQNQSGEAGVVAAFAGRMLDDRDITIYGDGEQTRDFVFVADVIDALVSALEQGDGARVNVGTGAPTSVNELFTELAAITGYAKHPSYAAPRPGELRHISLDGFAAEAHLGWRPCTELGDGLRSTVAWLRG